MKKMTKTKKQALSLLLLSGMLFTLCPQSAAAESGQTQTQETEEERKLICGKKEHTHSDDCYETVLTCKQEEGQSAYESKSRKASPSDADDDDYRGHDHDENCYSLKLICKKKEHTHSADCYEESDENESNPTEESTVTETAAEDAVKLMKSSPRRALQNTNSNSSDTLKICRDGGEESSIYYGDKFRLYIESSGKGPEVTWSVVRGVATIDENGNVTVTGVGKATISATETTSEDPRTGSYTFMAEKRHILARVGGTS